MSTEVALTDWLVLYVILAGTSGLPSLSVM